VIVILEERRQPWLYGGSGLLVGFVIILADQLLTDKPSIEVKWMEGRATRHNFENGSPYLIWFHFNQ
jgi:hypothetical protein